MPVPPVTKLAFHPRIRQTDSFAAFMDQLFFVVLGWAFTGIVSWSSGKLLLRRLSVHLYREEEDVFAFMAGSACLSTAVFFMTAAHLAYTGAFVALGMIPV